MWLIILCRGLSEAPNCWHLGPFSHQYLKKVALIALSLGNEFVLICVYDVFIYDAHFGLPAVLWSHCVNFVSCDPTLLPWKQIA